MKALLVILAFAIGVTIGVVAITHAAEIGAFLDNTIHTVFKI